MRAGGRILADEVLAPDLPQLGEVALQQAAVEVLLGGEVVVDDRRRHPRAPGDLVDRGALVAALGEERRWRRLRSSRAAARRSGASVGVWLFALDNLVLPRYGCGSFLVITRLTLATEGARVIVSVHIADVGPRAGARRRCGARPGPWRSPASPTPRRRSPPRRRREPAAAPPGRVGLIAAWENDDALERFLRAPPARRRLAGGWQCGCSRCASPAPGRDARPARARSCGRRRRAGGRAHPGPAATARACAAFLRSAAPGRGRGRRRARRCWPSTGLARPPRLVATFSLWRSAAAMREYAYRARRRPHGRRQGRPRAALPPRIGLHPLPPLRLAGQLGRPRPAPAAAA